MNESGIRAEIKLACLSVLSVFEQKEVQGHTAEKDRESQRDLEQREEDYRDSCSKTSQKVKNTTGGSHVVIL